MFTTRKSTQEIITKIEFIEISFIKNLENVENYKLHRRKRRQNFSKKAFLGGEKRSIFGVISDFFISFPFWAEAFGAGRVEDGFSFMRKRNLPVVLFS